jgi:hypothetical protein
MMMNFMSRKNNIVKQNYTGGVSMKYLLITLITMTGLFAQPASFNHSQSTLIASYYIWNIPTINGVDINSTDWVGAFNGDICVGAKQWDTSLCGNGICDIQVNGDDGWPETAGYMQSGGSPTFKIYDASENTYYNADPSENIPWNNFTDNNLNSLQSSGVGSCDGYGGVVDCSGTCNGTATDAGCGCGEAGPSGCDNACGSELENDECGVCGGDNSVCADCSGVPNGDSVEDNCGTCDNEASKDCDVCSAPNCCGD